MSCIVVKNNLSLSKCAKLPGMPKGMITTPPDFVIPAATLAAGEDAILAYLQAAMFDVAGSRIYFWPLFFTSENKSTDTVYQDTPLGTRKVYDGKYKFLFSISESMCLHKAMYTHRSTNGRMFILDADDQLLGTLASNGDFKGLAYDMLNTEKFKWNDGSVVTTSPVMVSLTDFKEIDQRGNLLEANFIGDLVRLADVELKQISGSTTVVKVTVKTECDGTDLAGLVTADFVLTKASDGTAQTVVVTYVNNQYVLTGTGLVTGNLNLRAANLLTVEGYEGSSIPITIPFP